MAAEPMVELHELTKTYGPTLANDRVSLTIARGEIIGLVGGNGAGKSTLMRMLCGEVSPDSGSIIFPDCTFDTRDYSAAEAQRRGIRTVHQELSLCDNLTVAENFYLESPAGTYPVPGWRRRYRGRAQAALESVFPGSSINVDAKVSDLSIGERQMAEIARALTAPNAEIVILDEPTSSLALDRSRQLQRYISRDADNGRAFIFISHKLKEIADVSTRTVVMRNGSVVWEGATGESSTGMIVSHMGGSANHRAKNTSRQEKDSEPTQPLAHISGKVFSGNAGKVTLRAGEIIGLAGLEGSGQKELLHAIFESSGKSDVQLERDAAVSFVSGDRQREGIFPLWSMLENISISRIIKRPGFLLVNRDKARNAAETAARHILLDTSRFRSGIQELSGGNQQKALVSRALACDAEIILLDDPTRGVDVAAKQDFYSAIKEIARGGKLVVWYSTEDLEFLECDRIFIFSGGLITREMVREDISEAAIVNASFENMEQTAAPARHKPSNHRAKLPEVLVQAAPFVSLAIVLIAMAWTNPLSMSAFGLELLLSPAVALVLVSFGQMFIIGGSEIDLGAGPFAAVINVISATILISNPPVGAIVILGVLVAYSGLGTLIQVRRIPAIVVTLGASFVWMGIGYTIQPAPGGSSPAWLASLSSISFPLVPTPIVYIIFFTYIAWLINRLPIGVVLRGFGNNPRAMSQSGWSPARYATIRYVVSGLFLLAAGLLLTSINSASDINSGNSFTLLSVAAVVIGGASLFGGRIHPIGAAAGAITLSLIGGLLVMLNVKSDYNAAVQGLLLLLILAFRAIAARWQEEE